MKPPSVRSMCRSLSIGLVGGHVLLRRRKEGQVPCVTLLLELGNGHEPERCRVHAVALPRRLGAVVEHVSQVGIGMHGADLGPGEEEFAILASLNVGRLQPAW